MSVNLSIRDKYIVQGPLLDYDNNVYTIVVINGQEWIVENLKTTHYADGSAIPNLTNAGDWTADVTGAYCWYNNDIGYKTSYGALYNWYAVNNVDELVYFKRDGVEETGWRIPTRAEYATLATYEGGYATAGGHLKEAGLAHWLTPNLSATNTHGFTALPGGERSSVGVFGFLTANGDLWTSTNYDVDEAYSLQCGYNKTEATDSLSLMKFGFSVRCVRDLV